MEAAGTVVGAVGRIVELASFYELMANPDPGSEPGGIVALGLGQTWRNGGHGQRPAAEDIERHLCQEGAVDAARIGHNRILQAAKRLPQKLRLGLQ